MVLAPEHPLVDELLADAWPDGTDPRWTGGAATPKEAVEAYRRRGLPQERARPPDRRAREDRRVPRRHRHQPGERRAAARVRRRLRADGLRHRRHHGRARPGPARLGLRRGLRPARSCARCSRPTAGTARPTPARGRPSTAPTTRFLDGLAIDEAKARITAWLAERGLGDGTVTYKLHDWLFSRQRYWGEPFPIVFDEHDLPIAVPDHELPVLLPEVDDYSPRTFAVDDTTSDPEPPLGPRRRLGRGRRSTSATGRRPTGAS